MAKKTYEAQNQIVGLLKQPLELRDEVELEEKDAAPFVAGGSLKEVQPRKVVKTDPSK